MRSNDLNHTLSGGVVRIHRVTLVIVFLHISSYYFILLHYFQHLVGWFWPLPPPITTHACPRLWPAKVHGVSHFRAERVVWGQPFWKLLQHLKLQCASGRCLWPVLCYSNLFRKLHEMGCQNRPNYMPNHTSQFNLCLGVCLTAKLPRGCHQLWLHCRKKWLKLVPCLTKCRRVTMIASLHPTRAP